MKNTSLRIKILSGILCTGLAFPGANLTFAATKNNGSVSSVATTCRDFKNSDNNKKEARLHHAEMKKSLDILVVKKVITIEQSNKVEKAITAKKVEKKENYKKMKDMNETDRKAYMKKMKNNRISPTKALIDNGTITKEQDIEIRKVLPHHNRCHQRHK